MTKNITLLLVIPLLVLLVNVNPCAAQAGNGGILGIAEQITENILQAMNDDDYARYSENFDEQMRKALPEAKFRAVIPQIKARIGSYVAKEYLGMETRENYTIVYYKAQFSGEPGTVIVKNVLSSVDGAVYVSGFWLDSPNLRK